MTLFDQFNKPTSSSTIYELLGTNVYQLESLGYISKENDLEQKELDRTPIFNFVPVKYNPPAPVKYIQVSNNIVFIGHKNNHIARIDLSDPKNIEKFTFTQIEDSCLIRKMFLDPSGNHLIIGCKNGENYYFHYPRKKIIKINKFPNKKIQSVAWNPIIGSNLSQRTDSILIGTFDGLIYETSFKKKELYVNQLYALPEENRGAKRIISSIYFQYWPRRSDKIVVIFITPSQLRQFFGGPTLEALFQQNINNQQVIELPSSLHYSQLSIYEEKRGESYIAWLNQTLLFSAKIDMKTYPEHSQPSVIIEQKLTEYPEDDEEDYNDYDEEEEKKKKANPPIAIANTKHHHILLYPTRFVAKMKLDNQTILDESFEDQFIGLSHDHTKNIIWLYSPNSIYEVHISNENRNVWKVFLDRKDYPTALQYSQTPSQKNTIRSQQAEDYFKKNRFEPSARIYAKTSLSFERVALKFSKIHDKTYLKVFLQEKLNNISLQNTPQLTMVATWLVEILLQLMIKNQNEKQMYLQLRTELLSLLGKCKEDKILGNKLIFNLLSAHGISDELVEHSEHVGEYELIISHYIHQEEYFSALEAIKKSQDKTMFIQFIPILLIHAPCKTVTTLKTFGKKIDPKLILPALMRYQISHNEDNSQENQAIIYLEYCVITLGNQDIVIHHYLLYLYAKHNQEKQLLEFLNPQQWVPFYSKRYALRMCTRFNQKRACVNLYSKMKLYEEAVDLALTFDPHFAKVIVQDCNDDEKKKVLWVKIAKALIEQLPPESKKKENNKKRSKRTKKKKRNNNNNNNHLSSDESEDSEEEIFRNKLKKKNSRRNNKRFNRRKNKNKKRFNKKRNAKYDNDSYNDEDSYDSYDSYDEKHSSSNSQMDLTTRRGVLNFLMESDVFDIETILPLFPSFQLIDDFKKEVVETLKKYNRQITKLRTEMETATDNSEKIKKNITNFQGTYRVIGEDQKCEICEKKIFHSDFVLFACQHTFHKKCLEQTMINNFLSKKELDRLKRYQNSIKEAETKIQRKLKLQQRKLLLNKNENKLKKITSNIIEKKRNSQLNTKSSRLGKSAPKNKHDLLDSNNDFEQSNLATSLKLKNSLMKSKKNKNININNEKSNTKHLLQHTIQKYKSEVKKILYGNCVICGEILIKSVDKPFINLKDDKEQFEMSTWKIKKNK
ncbi:vacuolar protein sorting-associated protein [Anaeramoeba flamelloides]|uniref:Vacuolar protein sorting-associated protein n=1 Tax=Anaeramoeba flamelloides TaxID=1746091 RepID=A0ABQ8Z8W8_9EUKA|nr:vacuolar protein sorting-associated protein [Anaeramoeba flamelloides]